MRAVLLSAGPLTLDRYDPDEQYGLRIGVNTAAAKYPVDWWSCADDCRYVEIEPIGTPHLFTMAPERDKMLAHAPDRMKTHQVTAWEDVKADLCAAGVGPPDGTMRWSCPSALVLARWLGVTELTCYGVDMVGAADCTGQRTEHRNPRRWQEEVVVWDQLVAWCRGAGMAVERITP
jgi:hypothetical protein